jgi:hypothetical protein
MKWLVKAKEGFLKEYLFRNFYFLALVSCIKQIFLYKLPLRGNYWFEFSLMNTSLDC